MPLMTNRESQAQSLRETRELPIFALQTWLFPRVPLALQVFEPRYLNMISRQLKRGEGFGVVAIARGWEVGRAPQVANVGLEVNLSDWRQQPNGVLGITVQGERVFSIKDQWVESDQLIVAEVEYLPSEQAMPLDESVSGLLEVLAQLKQHPVIQTMALPEVNNANELSWQLAQVLPFSGEDKAQLLVMPAAKQRLDFISAHIGRLSQA